LACSLLVFVFAAMYSPHEVGMLAWNRDPVNPANILRTSCANFGSQNKKPGWLARLILCA
jgi:hypothetical protein